MNTQLEPEPTGSEQLSRLSLGFIAIIIVIALIVLCGWQWDVPALRQFAPGLPAMNPMSALAFLLCSFSFLILAFPSRSRSLDTLGYLMAAAVLGFATTRLIGYFIPAMGQVDRILYTDLLPMDQAGGFPGRMAFNTALSFICWSVALFLLRSPDGKSGKNNILHPLALLMGLFGLLCLLAYIYGVKGFQGILLYLLMAVNTAGCFLLAALALMCRTPDRGIMKDLIGTGAGSITARRLIPFAFVVPIALGWLRLYSARQKAFTVEFGVAVLVLSIIVCFVFVIWYNARLLNRRDKAQRRMSEELRESERTFGLLVGSIRDYAIFMIDTEGRIKSWNPGARAIKGYTAEEVIGRPISIFYTSEELQQNEPAYNLHMAQINGSYRSEGWRIRKNGSRFWAEILFTALYDTRHRLQGFAKITRDMSEQKKANDMIRYQARLIEDISDAIIATDREFRIVGWNKATEKLFGFGLSEALGKRPGDLLRNPMDQPNRRTIRDLLEQQGYWYGEVLYYTKKNVPLNVLVSASATQDEQNTMTGYVIVCRDITERLKAEQRLVKFNEELSRQVDEKTAELRGIFERVTDAFMAFDQTGNIVYANRRANEIMGPDAAKIGINVFEYYPNSAKSGFGQAFKLAMETQTDQHLEVFAAALNLWLEEHIYPSPNGISLFFRDITAEKKVREDLSQSHSEMRALASHLQDVREEERADIAREIHDELGQQLTGLKMDLAWIDEKLAEANRPALRQRVGDTLQLLDHTIATVRKIAAELRPGILDDLGLVAAVEWQAEEFEKRSGIQTRFRAGMPGRRYPSAMSIGLFRICQEALTNVARHSGANHVDIFLGYEEDRIVLCIKDDGRGLSPVQNAGRKTLGLLGMKERALMMGGTMEIGGEYGKGVTLTIGVPMTAAEKT